MDDRDLFWRLLPIIAVVLIGMAFLMPGCADRNSGTADFYARLDRQAGGASP